MVQKNYVWNYNWEHLLMHGHHYFRLSLNKIVQNMKIITFKNGKFFSFFEEKAFVIASRPGELYWYNM